MLLLSILACVTGGCPEGTEAYDDVCLGQNAGAVASDSEESSSAGDTGDTGDTGSGGDTGDTGDTASGRGG